MSNETLSNLNVLFWHLTKLVSWQFNTRLVMRSNIDKPDGINSVENRTCPP